MDLGLYLRVLWRFRYIVGIGFVLAIVVAAGAYIRVSFRHGLTSPSVSYRQAETWQVRTRLLVTQQAFPWGRTTPLPASAQTSASTPPSTTTTSSLSGVQPTIGSSLLYNPNQFTSLAILYAQLLNSSAIQDPIKRHFPSNVLLTGQEVVNPSANNEILPLVDVIGIAPTRTEARRVSQAGANLFESYAEQQQVAAAVPANQRVVFRVVSTTKTLLAGRKKTLPVVAFLGIMIAAIGLAFILENFRPRVRALPAPQRATDVEIADRHSHTA